MNHKNMATMVTKLNCVLELINVEYNGMWIYLEFILFRIINYKIVNFRKYKVFVYLRY